MGIDPERMGKLADEILQNRKYRNLGIPRETILDLLTRENAGACDEKAVLKNVRKKMHQLIAPYLGDADYAQADGWLEKAHANGSEVEVRQACEQIMKLHASTRERMPHLDDFYQQVFSTCGKPASILDLACGFNPFALPWMGLSLGSVYRAYDIHTPRVKLINRFLALQGRPPLAEVRDILIHPPGETADMAFFFKEAHRMEQRRKGANRELWQALKVKHIIVSLPIQSLSGQHDLSRQMRLLMTSSLNGSSWSVQELISANEMIFCIQK
jgi:16S rRNA (guanine(1405)-N(7))-methyltransferase